ncbi:MAG: glycosyltransferase family 39 protein [Acidobacteria bacterium]|nr:glycosyltransferase family 39 protein [Acidobacteriota bacterium]
MPRNPPQRTELSTIFAADRPDQFQLDRADWMAIAVVVALAAVPRLLITVSLPPLLHLDSDSYFEITQRLWRGQGFGDLSRRAPLYPLFLWLTARFPQAGLFPVVLAQHLLGIGTAVLFYLIPRRLLAPRFRSLAVVCGLAAGILMYPALLEHSILSESLYTFLLGAAAYCLLAWVQASRDAMAVACGVLLGLAALTRPIGAGVFPLWLVLIFLLRGRKLVLRLLFFGGAAFAVLLLPLLARNSITMGSFSLEQSLGRNLISVTDRVVDYDRGVHPQIKSVYREYLKDKRGPDAVVVYSAMPRLRQATGWSDAQIDRALAEIAWEAIRAHPLEYLESRLRRLPLLFRDPGPSQSYALQAATYLPFLQFLGQINPELVSRSLVLPGRERAHFARAEKIYRVFAMDLTSGWLFLFSLLGIVGMIYWEPRSTVWLWAGLLAYQGFGTILAQPPNARYRFPTQPWEILFAVVGAYFLGRALLHGSGRLWKKVHPAQVASGLALRFFPSLSPAFFLSLATGAALAVVGGRVLLEIPTEPILRAADFRPTTTPTERIVRELAVAGRTFTVLYWNSEELGNRPETVGAEAAIQGGMPYEIQAAYSCQMQDCAGALLQVLAFDAQGQVLDSTRFSLSQERTDNDWFWDQITPRVPLPATARRLRVELQFQSGMGNAIVPFLVARPAPTLFTVWRWGIYGKIVFGVLWLAILGGALFLFRLCRRTFPESASP